MACTLCVTVCASLLVWLCYSAGTAAALCIQRQGAIPSLPTLEEVQKERAHHSRSGGGVGKGGSGSGSAAAGPTKAASAGQPSSPPKQSFW